jgi:hypothetical protein
MSLACEWGNANNLLVIWFGGIEIATHRHHSIPSSIGFEIISRWSGICDRSGLQECRQVSDITPSVVIGIHPNYAVWSLRISVRTASTGQEREQTATDKGYVCNAYGVP